MNGTTFSRSFNFLEALQSQDFAELCTVISMHALYYYYAPFYALLYAL